MPGPDVPQVSADEGAELVQGGAFLLDVREPNEWLAGHAAAAAHIPLGELVARTAEVPGDAPVVVICRSGARSNRAAAYLRGQGLDAVNLAGGMQSWAASGLDVITDEGDPGSVI
ncbi:MAG TPA: rhodanese-like domain-containing protein [Acidimicrobiales bacterium]|nr:rhodanese-like domain-containing protein [Acidimicrobiales bacterium]